MKIKLSLFITLSNAALTTLVACQPSLAQAFGNDQFSDAATGSSGSAWNNSATSDSAMSSLNHAPQNYIMGAPGSGTSGHQAPISRGGLAPTAQGLLGNSADSVDMSSLPSGTFNYGFGNGGAAPYFGPYQNSGVQGSMLPQVSTGSNDGNICDLPFIRLPNEDCPGSGGAGAYKGSSPAPSSNQLGGNFTGGTNPTSTNTGLTGNTGAGGKNGGSSNIGGTTNSGTTSQNLGALSGFFSAP